MAKLRATAVAERGSTMQQNSTRWLCHVNARQFQAGGQTNQLATEMTMSITSTNSTDHNALIQIKIIW